MDKNNKKEPKHFVLIYFFCMTFFLSLFSSGFVDSLDGFLYLTVARRMYYNHTLSLPPERIENGENIYLTSYKGKDGNYYSPTGLGYSLALVPAVFVEDMFLKIANINPISAFPLQSDWPVLLFASFTNSIFGALLAVAIYNYLLTYNIKKRSALFISFVTITCTNLFVYTKHVMAHMMFLSFLVSSFYLIRKYFISKNKKYVFLSGVMLGLTAISYNNSYLLALPPFIIYYLLSVKEHDLVSKLKRSISDGLIFISGFIPFYILNTAFNLAKSSFSASEVTSYLLSGLNFPVVILFENLWNVIISPGRGLLVYSPILLVLFLFWFKLEKKIKPEIIAFSLLSIIYILFIASLPFGSEPGWHGESSWGPRYLLTIIPFLMILVANIYSKLSHRERLFVFYPLAVLGLIIELVGILLPYQIKFAGLARDIDINGEHFNQSVYANVIPRYSPPLNMAKKLVKRVINLDKTYNHGSYNLRLYDGFEYPFDLGYTKWRAIRPGAKISLENLGTNSTIDILIRNHQIDEKSIFPVKVSIKANDIKEATSTIAVNKEATLSINLDENTKKLTDLTIDTTFIGTASALLKNKQVIFLEKISINGKQQNIETLDFPYVSPISQKLYGINYQYWGGSNLNYYDIWDVHSGVFEQTFDLWWLRPFHYWDFPKRIFLAMFAANIILFGYYARKLLKSV